MVRRARTGPERADALLLLQSLQLNRGRPQAALAAIDMLRAVHSEPRYHLWLRIVHALYSDGDTTVARDAARELDRFAAMPLPPREPERSWHYDAAIPHHLEPGRRTGPRAAR